MKILLLITDAFGGYGGIAKFNQNLLSALCSYKESIEIVAVPRVINYEYNKSMPSKLNYITVASNSKFKYILALLKIRRKIKEYDLVICGHINLLPFLYICRVWNNIPVSLIIHGVEAWRPSPRKLANHLIRRVDKFISVSETTKQRFLAWSKVDSSKCELLPNAIDLNLFYPGPKNNALISRYGLKDKTIMMTLARLDASEGKKGIDEVLDVMPRLVSEIHNLVYLIVGHGTDEHRLMRKVESLGMSDRTIFTGYIQEEEKVDHYRLADVFVMPGQQEGFGIVYLEAMACGIPVIASKLDGSREALHNGQLGAIVNPNNPEELILAILTALKQTNRSVPEGLKYFSFGNFVNRLQKIVISLTTGGLTK